MHTPTQLELKHLAAYALHGIYGFVILNHLECTTEPIKCKLIGFNAYGTVDLRCYDKSGHEWEGITTTSFENFKPIVRPLSDLNKIEPISGKKYIYLLEDSLPDFSFAITDKLKITYWTDEYEMIEENMLDLFAPLQILCKHHFDISGLIDAGLAVDVNSLPDGTV